MTTTEAGASPPTIEPDQLLAEQIRATYVPVVAGLQEIAAGIADLVANLEEQLVALGPPEDGYRLRKVTEVMPGDVVSLAGKARLVERVERTAPEGPWGRGGRGLHWADDDEPSWLPALARVHVKRLGADPTPELGEFDGDPWSTPDVILPFDGGAHADVDERREARLDTEGAGGAA